MTLVLAVIVGAILFGASPGLALIAVAFAVLAVDHHDPAILDRFRFG